MNATSDLLFVHDYGDWHIVDKAARMVALCGAAPTKPDWVSQMHFYEPRGLDVDERSVCGVCLYELYRP